MAFANSFSFPNFSLYISQTPKLYFPKPLFLNLSYNISNLSISKTHYSNKFKLFSSVETPISIELNQEKIVENEVEEEEDESKRTRILAQNVPWTCTVDDLRPLFDKYGTVVDIELSMYNKTRNRGLAFVTMGSNEEASAVISNMETSEFEGRTMKLAWAKPRKKKQPSIPKPAAIHNLYVANLPWQARAKDLKEFFQSDNVNAVSAEIIFQENPRRSAGYGFVSFYTKEEAEAALKEFQEKEFMGRGIRVAPSKKFLRQGTKEAIQAESESTILTSDSEQSEAAN